MLTQTPEFRSVFFDTSGCVKKVERIKVDGATDEGPAHEEVRFWWTARHLRRGNLVTLVSSRCSGSIVT